MTETLASPDSEVDALRKLQQTLRSRPADKPGPPQACDACRAEHSRCPKGEPCARCVRKGRECRYNRIPLKAGPPTNEERKQFEASGIPYSTFRSRLRARRQDRLRAVMPHLHSSVSTPATASPPSAGHASPSASFTKKEEPRRMSLPRSASSPALEVPQARARGSSLDGLSTSIAPAPLTAPANMPPSGLVAPTADHSAFSSWLSHSVDSSDTSDDNHDGIFFGGELGTFSNSFPASEAAGHWPALWSAKAIIEPSLPDLYAVTREADGSELSCSEEVSAESEGLCVSIDGLLCEAKTLAELPAVTDRDWQTIGPAEQMMGPDWVAQAKMEVDVPLWPNGYEFQESDYDLLRRRAHGLLASPVIDELLACYTRWIDDHWPCLHMPTLRQHLKELRAPIEQPTSFPPVQVRQRQAVLLLVCAIASLASDGVSVLIGGQAKRADVGPFASQCYRLAWALLCPRQPSWDDEEISLELWQGIYFYAWPISKRDKHPLTMHRMLNVERALSVRIYQSILQTRGYHSSEMEAFRRTFHGVMGGSLAMRAWADNSLTLAFGPYLSELGASISFLEEVQSAPNTHFHDLTRLFHILQDILDSPLCSPIAPQEDALSSLFPISTSAKTLAAAHAAIRSLKSWRAQALSPASTACLPRVSGLPLADYVTNVMTELRGCAWFNMALTLTRSRLLTLDDPAGLELASQAEELHISKYVAADALNTDGDSIATFLMDNFTANKTVQTFLSESTAGAHHFS